MRPLILLALLIAIPAAALADDPAIAVSEARLRADVERMVAFGTRHTLSAQDHTLEADPAADLNSIILAPDRGDDWIFGVSAVAADGAESPVASAVPGGDFYPLPHGD